MLFASSIIVDYDWRFMRWRHLLKVDWTFELLLDPLLTISPNLFFLKELTVISLQSK